MKNLVFAAFLSMFSVGAFASGTTLVCTGGDFGHSVTVRVLGASETQKSYLLISVASRVGVKNYREQIVAVRHSTHLGAPIIYSTHHTTLSVNMTTDPMRGHPAVLTFIGSGQTTDLTCH